MFVILAFVDEIFAMLARSPRAIERQALPRNENILPGSSDQGSYHKVRAFFLNIHSERAFYYCLLRVLLSKQCQRVPALPLLPLNFQHSELEKRR